MPPVPVEPGTSEVAERELTWLEDTGLASNVEVANVELSVVDMLEVNDDSGGVSDGLGISEHSPVGIGVAGSVMGVILVNRVGMSVSVELPPTVGSAACLGILAACVRRHGRFRRGPASTAAMRDKACNISVVGRIFAVFEYVSWGGNRTGVKTAVKGPAQEENTSEIGGWPGGSKQALRVAFKMIRR
jgi:hypothetical protein